MASTISKSFVSREVERFLLKCIPTSPWNGKVYSVGGSVRDTQLGLPSDDVDLVIEEEGGAERLAAWIHKLDAEAISRPHHLGAGYPIWQLSFLKDVHWGGEFFPIAGHEIEIADTQAECFPDPKTRQRITVPGNLAQDCARRDFTVNMLYRNLSTGEILDPSGRGLSDIQSGVLRGHPDVDLKKIFSDDPLRMVRLVRFQTRFGWTIPGDVRDCVAVSASRVSILSAERIRSELDKIIAMEKLADALELFLSLGLLKELFPELMPMVGCGQDRVYHSEGDVWVHTLRVIRNSPPTPALQLAALLHDIGKPPTRSEHGERVKFLGHESISAELSESFMARLKWPKELREKVVKLVRLHLRGGDVSAWTGLKPARKLLRDAGEELEDLLSLIEADSKSSLGADGNPRLEHLPVLREKLQAAQLIPLRRKPLLDGHVLMKEVGLMGPQIKEAQAYLMELEDNWAERGEVLEPESALRALKDKFN